MRICWHVRVARLSLAAAGVAAACGGTPAPATPPPSLGAGTVLIAAKGQQFTPASVHVPAGIPWTLAFDNQDGLPHNVVILDKDNRSVFSSSIFTGPALKTEAAPAFAAGDYHFTCALHPEMRGSQAAP